MIFIRVAQVWGILIVMTNDSKGFQLISRKSGDVILFDVVGELSESHCARFKRTLKESIDGGMPWIVLQMDKVTLLGSHAFGILLFLRHEAMVKGGQIRILNPSPAVRQVLQETGGKYLLECFEDEESALKSFRPNLYSVRKE